MLNEVLQMISPNVKYKTATYKRSGSCTLFFYKKYLQVILPESNFIEIALQHGCSPENVLNIFRTPFPKNTFC